jgi:hypothetical protein
VFRERVHLFMVQIPMPSMDDLGNLHPVTGILRQSVLRDSELENGTQSVERQAD